MPPPLTVLARRIDGRIVVEPKSVPLQITLSNLRSADGHDVTLFVAAALRPVDRPADVQLLAEQFLSGRDSITVDDLRRPFTAPLTQAASEFVAQHEAAACLTQQASLQTLLLQRLDAVGFGCGLQCVPPLAVTIDSESLRRDEQARLSRQRQLDELDHAAALAAKLATVGPVGNLPSAQQAAMLPTLLAAAPPAGVLVSAGPNLFRIESDGSLHGIPMPDAVGPLRCVRLIDHGHIAAGGTGGVALLDPDLRVTATYPGGHASGRGFNSIVERQGKLIAAHGEIGLAVWDKNLPTPPLTVATPGPARFLTRAGEHVAFAAGGMLCRLDGHATTVVADGVSAIAAVFTVGEDLCVARQDGTLTMFDVVALKPRGTTRVATTIGTIAPLEVGGIRSVLVASDHGGVDCVTTDGQPLVRFDAKSAGLRMIAAAGNRIVAVSLDRTGVLIWDASSLTEPRVVNVLARTGHHITDIQAVPAV